MDHWVKSSYMNQYLKRVLLSSALVSLAYYFIVVDTSLLRDVVTLYTNGGATLIEALTGDTLRVFPANDGIGRIFNDGAGSDGTFIYVSIESDVAFLLFIALFAILFRGACSVYKVVYMCITAAVLLALNFLRISLMYLAMAYYPLQFDLINVIFLPLALLLVAACFVYIWSRISRPVLDT